MRQEWAKSEAASPTNIPLPGSERAVYNPEAAFEPENEGYGGVVYSVYRHNKTIKAIFNNRSIWYTIRQRAS